ncbi:MAG: tetratricopeptide repeat protein, partial [Gammaproteobacteria bacterium]|nr:tetratricopeptide repeat protein [Gammaproteobacteria bacterium]
MSQLVANKIRPVLLITAALLFAAACADDATRIERAKAFQAEGEYRAAVIELKNVLRSDAENSEARALLGQISLLNGDTATAIKELQRSRELGAQSDDYLVPLARALIREARYPEVIKLNPQSLSDPENQAALLAIMGNAELSRGDQREAENNFDAALKVVPGQADALIGKARLAQDRGNFKQAE